MGRIGVEGQGMDYIARKGDFKNESRNIKEGEITRRKKEFFLREV